MAAAVTESAGATAAMLLALTSLSDWWEQDEAVLLLGPWCLPHGKREKPESSGWRMLPSPWEDRDRLSTASAYAETVYRRLLPKLSAQLNQLLDVQEPLAHWRVLIGPWLLHFVHSVYDRYAHLLDALSFAPCPRSTSVLAESCFRTPQTTRDALTWLPHDDHYNWQLFSELLALMQGTSGALVTRVETMRAPRASPRGPSRVSRWTNRAQAGALRRLAGGRRAWLTGVTASRVSLLGLAARSRLQVIPAPIVDVVGQDTREPAPDTRRSLLGELAGDDEFEAICIRLLSRHVPTVYLEGYHGARRTVRRWYPCTPALLVTETEWFMNETYKYLVADAMDRGTRLVTVQHGGYYGYTWPMPFEDIEREIGQAFFVWGWAGGHPSLRNIPHPIVSTRPKRLRSGARILFAVHVTERYMYRLGSTGAGSLWEPQWQWQVRFIGALPPGIRQRLAVRPPPHDIGHHVLRRLGDHYPEISVDGSGGFKPGAAQSRLIVLERPGTCLLESLAMNHPTVVFWEPTLWNLRSDAKPYVDALRKVGILWESPEAAAAHVAAVYDEPSTWWETESVQAARGAFVEHFALARRDWPGRWIEAIREELST